MSGASVAAESPVLPAEFGDDTEVFLGSGYEFDAASDIAATPSGALWVVLTKYAGGGASGVSRSRLVRLSPAGEVEGGVELAINPETGEGTELTKGPQVEADGEAVVVQVSAPGSGRLLRFDETVERDESFATSGELDLGAPLCEFETGCYAGAAFKIDSQRRILVRRLNPNSGEWLVFHEEVLRFEADGTVDTSFGAGGHVVVATDSSSWASFSDVFVDAEDRLLIYDGFHQRFNRVTEAGAVDPEFAASGLFGPEADGWRCFGTFDNICNMTMASDGTVIFPAVLPDVDGAGQLYGFWIIGDDLEVREYCRSSADGGDEGCTHTPWLAMSSTGGQEHLTFIAGWYNHGAIAWPLPEGGDRLITRTDHRPMLRQMGVVEPIQGTGLGYTSYGRDTGVGPRVVIKRFTMAGDATDMPGAVLSPRSGEVALGAQVPIEFACRHVDDCAVTVHDGDPVVPLPREDWWDPYPRIGNGQLLDTATPGVRTVIAWTWDLQGSGLIEFARSRFVVGEGGASGSSGVTVDGGTFAAGDVPDPILTSVRTPHGGAVSIDEQSSPGTMVPGYEWFGVSSQVSAPLQAAAAPLETTFLIDRAALDRVSASKLVVAHGDAVMRACVGGSNAVAANPDPCVKVRRNDTSAVTRVVLLSTGGIGERVSFGRMTATAPQGPQGVVAAPGLKAIDVSWSPLSPVAAGGAPVRDYRVIATPVRVPEGVTASAKTVTVGGVAGGGPATAARLTGLVSGVEYSVQVQARNVVMSGWGEHSQPPVTVTTPDVPGVTLPVSSEAGIRSATVSWSAPWSDLPITAYTVVAEADRGDGTKHRLSKSVKGDPPATTYTFTGLTPGMSYAFSVAATSAAGPGPASPLWLPVQLIALPGPSFHVEGLSTGARTAEVSWATPESDLPVLRYDVVGTATRADGTRHRVSAAVTGEPAATSHSFTGLEIGLAYSFTVVATNAVGKGPESLPSAPVSAPAAPATPIFVEAVPGVRSATVTWIPGESDLPVTRYTVTGTAERRDGSIHRVSSSLTGAPVPTSTVIGGMTPGLSYAFTVAATSSAGTSAASTPSAPVVPDFGISIANRSVAEGDRGQIGVAFAVSLTHAQDVPVTVEVVTVDGTADESDYVPATTTVVFEPGQTIRTVSIRVRGDTVVEPDETFFVDIADPSSGVITNARGTGTILNDD